MNCSVKGAPGIHFYVMNKSYSVREVMKRLNAKGIVFLKVRIEPIYL
jgi:hypothetical protein